MANLGWLALAGAIGTLCRFGLTELVQWLIGHAFPWGTLTVNVLGCFLFGLIWPLAETRLLIRPETALILLVGFLGGFTTFSSYAFQVVRLVEASEWLPAVGYLLASNVLGILAVLAGLAITR